MPTATQLEIRPARPAERAAIKQLWLAAGMGEPAQEELDALMLHETSRVLVAMVDGEVGGTAVASYDGWRAYIYHVAVAPALRRKGIGHELMAEAERYLRSSGARYVYLTVNEENTEGLALAAEAGYVPEGEIVLARRLRG
jgi:ribosomal protein S18 acetylase RimI-like enzyme